MPRSLSFLTGPNWRLPDLDQLPVELQDEDLVGVGGELSPTILLSAYQSGLFPMHVDIAADGQVQQAVGWWSPQPRGILPLSNFRITRSLRQSMSKYETTIDRAIPEVLAGCADRPGRWINQEIADAYLRLFELGWVHSIETWEGGQLVGGLYGVAIGGFFAGESMFHRKRDASKVALARLVRELRSDGVPRLLDVQWVTDHLESLGAVAISREAYRVKLADALAQRPPQCWPNATAEAAARTSEG